MDASALAKTVSSAEKSIDALYPWLFGATAVVVLGLAVEYWPAIRELFSERPLNRRLLIEMIGGVLVIVGVAGELVVQSFQHSAETALRIANDQYTASLSGDVNRLGKNLADLGVQLEQEKARLVPSPPAPPAPTPALTGEAMRIIRETTKQGAIVSIIPFMPNLEPFALELGRAFASVPGVQVSVGHGSMIMNGQTGVIVQYDHTNPVSASVFDALQKAGLHPVSGPAVPGTPIVFIKIASG